MDLRLGDVHNFGKRTAAIVVDGQTIFLKPRPVFWEYFFFGAESPLLPIFERDLVLKDLSDLFVLKVDRPLETRGGSVHLLAESSMGKLSWRLFGMLNAYCTFFGLSDLHANNLVRRDSAFVPVDIECAFMPMLLPNETGLLPHRTYKTAHCIFHKISGNGFTSVDFADLFNGFRDCMIALISSEGLKEFLSSRHSLLSSVPIRILLRPSADYSSACASGNFTEFFPEEKIQLSRGDIPYFYTTLQTQKLFYYADEKYEVAEFEYIDPRFFSRGRAVALPDILLRRQRCETLLASSLLWLTARLPSGPLRLSQPGYSVVRSQDDVRLSLGPRDYIARLR